MLQKVLIVSRDQADSNAYVQKLLKNDITYEELEVLLGRDQKTKHFSKSLKEKLEQSELVNLYLDNCE